MSQPNSPGPLEGAANWVGKVVMFLGLPLVAGLLIWGAIQIFGDKAKPCARTDNYNPVTQECEYRLPKQKTVPASQPCPAGYPVRSTSFLDGYVTCSESRY